MTEVFKPKRPEAPAMPQGYIHIRRGVFDHTASGNMTPYEYCVYSTLHEFVSREKE